MENDAISGAGMPATWEDIGGLEDAKEKLKDKLQHLLYLKKFTKFCLPPFEGVLLYGPPGCGKSMLVKAFVNEWQAKLITISSPTVQTKVCNELVKNASQTSPPCVLFFDELDTWASRSSSQISQIVNEIDELRILKNVLMIGATTRPDILDADIMRPGRLTQLIYVPLPDTQARVAILKAKLKNAHIDKDVSLESIAERTAGYSSVDMTEICQKACLLAIRLKGGAVDGIVPTIISDHFEEAIASISKSVTDSDNQKYEAYHQSTQPSTDNAFKFPQNGSVDNTSQEDDL